MQQTDWLHPLVGRIVNQPDAQSTFGDVPPEIFRKQLHQIADWIADYRETIPDRAISPTAPPGTIARSLPQRAPEKGESFESIWRDFEQIILPGIVHWGHPQFMGYFGSTTTAPGILAEMAAAALNVNAMTWRTSPAATELETVVLDWLRQWLELPPDFGGVIYDTASIGIMHALGVAREEAAGSIRELGMIRSDLTPLRIYTSDQAHSSVEKAAIALGIGEKNVCRVPADAEFRMEISALREMIEHDIRQDFKPLAVVATVGTTSTASVDPVPAIAQICRDHGLWLHIDGAYGAGLALLPEASWVKTGWAEADSIVVNPHKMLFVPFDFSALYVKKLERLRAVFALVPDYLKGDSVGADINYMDYGVQLGRRFRALKAWMVWRTFGREGLAARIREHLRLARLFAGWIDADNRFELLAPVTMAVVCFALKGRSEAQCRELVEKLNSRGQLYLTQTRLHGRHAIRLGLGNILTTETHLHRAWELILNAAD
jgi:aromatic-L-amino-acid/L-tryptophan decarboxylase